MAESDLPRSLYDTLWVSISLCEHLKTMLGFQRSSLQSPPHERRGSLVLFWRVSEHRSGLEGEGLTSSCTLGRLERPSI